MGIIADFSEWQLTVDWVKVSELHKNGTLDGVILRVQAGYTHPDTKYEEYVAGCRQYGIPFGTYAYFKGVSVADAIKEAQNALSLTDKDSKCFAVDIEEVSMSDLVSGGQAFVDHLKQNGMQNVGIYSYTGFYNAHNLAAIKADWHWIAAYGVNDGQPHTDPQIIGESLWQFTSVAHLDGVSTNVDESKVTGNFPFFGGTVTQIATPATSNPDYQFCTKPTILQTLRCDGPTDIRTAPRHDAPYVRDTQKGEVFHVFDKVRDAQGHCWDNLGGANWVDEASGVFYWLDNPALNQNPVYYVIKSGDTLSKIAAANGTTVNQLVGWNSIKDPNVISIGQRIRIK